MVDQIIDQMWNFIVNVLKLVVIAVVLFAAISGWYVAIRGVFRFIKRKLQVR